MLDGFYGRTRRRQRYRCYAYGARGHFYVERLPLQQPPDGHCPYCAQQLAHPHHGFPGPRQHQYTAREIAQALIAVGQGQSYTAAAKRRRRAAGRTRGYGNVSDDASLVMDWVETFAPVLERALCDRAWPGPPSLWDPTARPAVVLVDDLPFHIRAWKTRAGVARLPRQSGRRIFSILAAARYQGDRIRIVRLHAVPTATSEARWEELLRILPVSGYAPPVLLSDEAIGLRAALQRAWPLTQHAFCVYHLRRQIETLLPPALRTTPQRRAVIAGLHGAFTPPVSNWDAWVQHARALHLPRLVRWLNRKEPTIRQQLGWTYWPVSIGGLEVRLQRVKAMLDRRRWAYRNAKRMDRLLALVTLHLNEQDDEDVYVRLIERHLVANYGRPFYVRHVVYDRRGQPPSLRRAA